MAEKKPALTSRLYSSLRGSSRPTAAAPLPPLQPPSTASSSTGQTSLPRSQPARIPDNSDTGVRSISDNVDVKVDCGDDCVLKLIYQKYREAVQEKQPVSSVVEPDAAVVVPEAAPHPDIYKPLKPWQTRLIELYAGSGTDRLRCYLHRVEFIHMPGVGLSETDRIVYYEALSYSWGTSSKTFEIECNGFSFNISQSLAVALQYLRPREGSRFLWVDAICINQADNAEKANQVKNILQIFEKAERIVAWIGEPLEKNIKLAFYALEASQLHPPHTDSALFSRSHTAHCFMGLEQAQYGFRSLCRKPWFWRTWVRQEVFAAKDLTIICGTKTIPYHILNTYTPIWLAMKSLLLSDHNFYGVNISSNISGATTVTFSILASHFQHAGTDRADYEPPATRFGHAGHWFRTFQEGTSFAVTDPIDRVYGVLGMLQSRTTRSYVFKRDYNLDDQFPIDYTQTVSRVFQDVIKFLINTDKNLDALVFFEERKFPSGSFPHWTPDWRTYKTRDFIQYPKHGLPRSEADYPLEQNYDDEGKLTLKGYVLISQLDAVVSKSSYYNDSSGADIRCFPDPSQLHGEQNAIKLKRARNYITAVVESIVPSSGVMGMDFMGTAKPKAAIWVPRTSTVDDSIVYLVGAECFFVLRQLSGSLYQFIGPAIVATEQRITGFWDFLNKTFPDRTRPEFEKTFTIV